MEYVPAFPINSAAHEKLLDVIKVSICADLVKLQTLVRSCRTEQDLHFLQQFSVSLQKCATQLETGVAEAGEVIPSPHKPEPATVNCALPRQDNNPEVERFLSGMELSLKDSAASWSRKRSFADYSAEFSRAGYSYTQQKRHEHVEKNDASYQVTQTVPRGPLSTTYQTEMETRKKLRTSTTVWNKRTDENNPLNALYRLLECKGAVLKFEEAVPDWDEHGRELWPVRCYYQRVDVFRLLIGWGTGSSTGDAKRAAAQMALANEVLMKDLSAFKQQTVYQPIVTRPQTSEPSPRIIESHKPSIASQPKPLVKPSIASQSKPLVNGINTERRALSCLDGKDCANRATCFLKHESEANATAKTTSSSGVVEATHHNAAIPAVDLLRTNKPRSPTAVIKLE